MEQKNDVIITQARYLASAVRKDQYPAEKKPEFVFIGRSNVGKSSLINSLTRVKNLARVSSQPGKTQTINFYELGAKLPDEEERRSFYLVDLPDYGYAKTSREKRKLWSSFIEEYLKTSEQLQFVCQLIDIRHAPMASDVEMFQWLVRTGIPVLVIATKTDKIGKQAREKQVREIQKALGVPDLSVMPYSSLKNEGRSELLDVLRDSLLQ